MIEKKGADDMNVDILKILLRVVEQKHFSRAAELLNLSQAWRTYAIRNLETNLELHSFSDPPRSTFK